MSRFAHSKTMVNDRKVLLTTGSMNFTSGAAQNSENVALVSSEANRRRLYGPLAESPRSLGAVHPPRRLVQPPRCGRAQIGIAAVMKPEQDDRLEAGGDLSKPGEFSLRELSPLEIVRQVDNPTL